MNDRWQRAERTLLVLLLAAVLVAFFAFTLDVMVDRGAVARAPTVAALRRPPIPGFFWYLGIFVLLLGGALWRAPALVSRRSAVAAVVLLGIGLFFGLVTSIGHTVGAVLLSGVLALLIVAVLPPRSSPLVPSRKAERAIPFFLWGGTTAVFCLFAMHRHWAFGSGSWDMGCMIHNFYRASRFLDTTSTVLGEVDFLGDHFMIGIYLYAPIFWIDSSGYTLLLIQSVSLAAAAPALFLIARHHGADLVAALVLALCGTFMFGMQSAVFFDSHEITVGFGFLCFAVWALETGRLRLATLLLALFALFKESLGAYVVALGMLAIWRGVRARDRRPIVYGAAWIAGGAIWFVLVNRVFMPALIARANAPEPHETFGDFGPTVFTAVIGILTHPVQALSAVFVPDEKVLSLAVTFLGVSGLSFLSPEIGLAALPLIAERFLSSKRTMWEMGYHYAAPLSFYAAWAAAVSWPRAKALAERVLGHLDGGIAGLAPRAPAFLGLLLIGSTVLVNSFGYRHVANFHRWREPYFSQPVRREANAAAVDLVKEQAGPDAKVAAQNRILPHLADRRFIYRLGEWQKTEWVVLSVGESAWPWHDNYARQVARTLHRRKDWRLVLAQDGTAVFARENATDLPPVEPTPQLGL